MAQQFDGSADPANGGEVTRLVYDGRTGELLVLWLKVLLLGVVTLGIYSRFWGRTRIRKYFWSHVSLLGERFEYDGTGGELFRRFLVAIIVLPVLFFSVPLLALLGVGSVWLVATQLIQVSLIVFLIFLSQYGSRRYQMSRTLWHGIRGGCDGSAVGYAVRAIGYSLLLPVTLGIAFPWRYVALWRYKTNNTGFGDVDFHFEGAGSKLLKPFLVAYAATILGLVLVGLVVWAVLWFSFGLRLEDPAKSGPSVPMLVATVIIAYIAYLAITIVAYLHFYSRAIAYTAAGTRFGQVAFAAPIRRRDLFWFQFGNFLLLVFTLGFALAFVGQRYVRFFCENLRIYHAHELAVLTQAPGRRRPRGGEGLAQLFDTLDVGGFI